MILKAMLEKWRNQLFRNITKEWRNRRMRKREIRNWNTVDKKRSRKEEKRKNCLKEKEKRIENKLNQFFHQHLMFLKFFIASLFVLVLFSARNVLNLENYFLFLILKILHWINIFYKQHVNILFKKNKREIFLKKVNMLYLKFVLHLTLEMIF
jgi:hypothetical protein